MNITPEMIARTQRDWSAYANEPVRVESICGTLYGFGSELATLRIYRKYQGADFTGQGFSATFGGFYFSLDVEIQGG